MSAIKVGAQIQNQVPDQAMKPRNVGCFAQRLLKGGLLLGEGELHCLEAAIPAPNVCNEHYLAPDNLRLSQIARQIAARRSLSCQAFKRTLPAAKVLQTPLRVGI